MLDTIFENDKLYYFKNTKELPDFDTILFKSDFSIFNPIQASLSDSVSIIKNKLEKDLNERVELSNFIKESDSFNEHNVLNTSLWDVTEKYDWDVFNGIEVISGIELNNIIENDNLIIA
jgi:hypothetical protein